MALAKPALLACLLVAACAVAPAPATTGARPQDIWLGGETLRVRFTDGTTCRATVPLAGGEGELVDCPHSLSYEVTVTRRNWLEPFLGATVAPYARVVLRDAEGRVWRYRTPPLPGPRDRRP